MPRSTIAEKSKLTENIASVGSRKMRIRIIEGDRWGSSGWYSSEMLKRDGAAAFPAGTQMYIDHPGHTEEHDRPERTIKDLAAVFETDPVYEKDGLYTDVNVYSHWAPVLAEMASDIGVSIRALAEMEPGEVGGRRGNIVKSLIEGISVDFVTKAGAGGKVVQLIESARDKAEEALAEASTGNRRAQLQSALSAAYGEAWVNDFDETEKVVYFTQWIEGVGSKSRAQKFAPSDDDNSVTLDGDSWEVIRQTSYVPVPATGNPTAETDDKNTDENLKETAPETPGKNKKGSSMGDTTIAESELATLRERAASVDALREQLTEAQKDAKDARIGEAKAIRWANREHARRVVGEMLADAKVKAPRLAASLAVDPPLLEADDAKTGAKAGTVDEAKLREGVKEAIDEITVEVDEGGVRGFGAAGKADDEVTDKDLDELAESMFDRPSKGQKVSA